MSGKFILRVRSSEGMARFNFESSRSTLGELQQKVEEKYNVPPPEQILSRQPPSTSPDFIEGPPDAPLSELGFSHGDMIYLVIGHNHVTRIRREEAARASPKKKMKVTLETSEWVNDPRHKEVDLGPKHLPFHEWIQARQKTYSNQPWNIDPPKLSYTSVPYAGGVVRFREVPPNAVVKRQAYRHCDGLSVRDTAHLGRFKAIWEHDKSTPRAAFMIGNYSEVDDHQREGKTRLQANVYVLYVPPQTGHEMGVKFLPDPAEERIDAIIQACGMERVGWCITTRERLPDEKYLNLPIFMTGEEIFTACRFQTKYQNPNTEYSRFVTLIVHEGMKEPDAFMISDQGVAMIRDGLVTYDEDDAGFLKVREHPTGVYVAGVINENNEIPQGGTFLPDALLVNVVAGAANVQEPKFQFMSFPENGTEVELRQHLTRHRDKEYHVIFSDFNLLTFLPNVLPLDLVCQIAAAVVSKERLDPTLRNQIHERLARFRA